MSNPKPIVLLVAERELRPFADELLRCLGDEYDLQHCHAVDAAQIITHSGNLVTAIITEMHHETLRWMSSHEVRGQSLNGKNFAGYVFCNRTQKDCPHAQYYLIGGRGVLDTAPPWLNLLGELSDDLPTEVADSITSRKTSIAYLLDPFGKR